MPCTAARGVSAPRPRAARARKHKGCSSRNSSVPPQGGLAPLLALGAERHDLGRFTSAAAQRFLKAHRAAVFLQEITEGLVGKLLERHHAALGEHVERGPHFLVDLNAFPRHCCLRWYKEWMGRIVASRLVL